jgi:hypothetical protein
MQGNQFDKLAQQYAAGLSRRQLLKALIIGAFGGLLAKVGLTTSTNQYVAAQQATQHTLFLPMIGKPICTTASQCESRQYCSGDQGCLCLRSAEGELRCGEIPSSCAVRLCQTSADCADLGAGYFCDTPNSGCCTDPPASLARCIAPCTTTTPTPTPTATVTPNCTAERLCGANCCAPGQRCVNGTCITPTMCESDLPSSASIMAAAEALEAGVSDVALSPAGCFRYRRTQLNSQTRAEEMSLNGLTTLRWEHTATQSVGMFDHDLDGFFEERIDLVYDPSFADTIVSQRQYDPATGRLVRRESIQPVDAQTRRITWEEADTSGLLQVVADFTVPIGTPYTFDQPVLATPTTRAAQNSNTICQSGCGTAGAGYGTCTIEQLAIILNRIREGVAKGVECLERNGRGDLARKILDVTVTNRFSVFCKDTGNAGYVACNDDCGFPQKPVIIHINRDKFFGSEGTESNQRMTMFHEFLHLEGIFGGHPANIGDYSQFDPVRACTELCFNPNANQCHCTTCLHSRSPKKLCDERCQRYAPCNSGPNQCNAACCVGPCEGEGCCPPERICNKKFAETAICCPTGQQCYDKDSNDPMKGSFCCEPEQLCPNQEGSDRKCCPPGEQCVQNPGGTYTCCPQEQLCDGTCCPPDQQCITRPDGSQFCCSAIQACPATGTIGGPLVQCCPDGTSCRSGLGGFYCG